MKKHRAAKTIVLAALVALILFGTAMLSVARDSIISRIEYRLTRYGLIHRAGDGTLPPPYATPSVYHWPQIIPVPANAKLTVPPGFSVEPYAEKFLVPRYMAMGFNGEVLVADSMPRPTGAVYMLEPDQGSRPIRRKKLISGLNFPYGIALWKDYIYVGERESIERFRYDPQTQTVGPAQEVVSLKGFTVWHWTRTLLFDPKGEKLYVSIGSGSNDGLGEDPRRAAINRYNPDGTGHELYASGLRNAVGIRWYPGTETMWATVQERDDMGDDVVPDYFTHIQQGGFYGWPYAYIGPHEDPRNAGLFRMRNPTLWLRTLSTVPELIKSTVTPDVILGGHVGVLDTIFYTGSQFPQEYRGGAFLALHGSVNRSKLIGYSIAFIPFRDGRPCGPMREFMAGWHVSPGEGVWGRPVGLLQLPDGSLLVSDEGTRKLWRVRYHPS